MIAMNPTNGHILAWAHYPNFDLQGGLDLSYGHIMFDTYADQLWLFPEHFIHPPLVAWSTDNWFLRPDITIDLSDHHNTSLRLEKISTIIERDSLEDFLAFWLAYRKDPDFHHVMSELPAHSTFSDSSTYDLVSGKGFACTLMHLLRGYGVFWNKGFMPQPKLVASYEDPIKRQKISYDDTESVFINFDVTPRRITELLKSSKNDSTISANGVRGILKNSKKDNDKQIALLKWRHDENSRYLVSIQNIPHGYENRIILLVLHLPEPLLASQMKKNPNYGYEMLIEGENLWRFLATR
jgi:hypothetical protein